MRYLIHETFTDCKIKSKIAGEIILVKKGGTRGLGEKNRGKGTERMQNWVVVGEKKNE